MSANPVFMNFLDFKTKSANTKQKGSTVVEK